MSDVFEIIRRAKSIPLDELVLRSSQAPEVVTQQLRMLADKGLIHVKGDIPSNGDLLSRASGTVVMLSSKGISANTA
jgi:predicted transcriptional regulator